MYNIHFVFAIIISQQEPIMKNELLVPTISTHKPLCTASWNPENCLHVLYPRSQASTPSFCCLQYKKQGEGLEGFITWCALLLTSLNRLASTRICIATIARALAMLASTAEKPTWCVRSFCLVKSSYENVIVGVGTSSVVINPSRPYLHFPYSKWQKLGMEAWERG